MKSKRFNTIDDVVSHLKEVHDQGDSNDWSWEEGFICGMADETSMTDEEECYIRVRMKN